MCVFRRKYKIITKPFISSRHDTQIKHDNDLTRKCLWKTTVISKYVSMLCITCNFLQNQ